MIIYLLNKFNNDYLSLIKEVNDDYLSLKFSYYR